MAASVLCARSESFGEDLCNLHVGSENRFKRRRQKTVSWPVDQKICEVRCFVADDAPSFVRTAGQADLQCTQGKASSYNEASYTPKRARVEEDTVPPGFGLSSRAGKSPQPNAESDVVMAVALPWDRPLKFLLDASWLWVGGEESSEVALQQQRERRCFESFYPRLASIPDSPSELQGPSEEIDDALVPQIPLVALEEEEMLIKDTIIHENGGAVSHMAEPGADALFLTNDGLHSSSMKQKQESIIHITDSNIAAAAAAACMVVKALGESDLVDEKLLLEILKNPSLLKSLTGSSNFMKGNTQDHDSSPPRTRQGAPQEPQSRKLPIENGAYLNSSPVNGHAQWGRGSGIANSHRLPPIANSSTHIQQPTYCSSVSVGLPQPTRQPTSYSCSNSESSMDLVQTGDEGTLRTHKQAPEHKQLSEIQKLNSYSFLELNDACSVQENGPRNEMGSKNEYSSKNSYTCLQAPMHTSPSFRRYPTKTPIKDLPYTHPMQVEPTKYTSAEANQFRRKTIADSSISKRGARAKRPCMYYNSPRGCRNGERCAFSHQSIDSETSTFTQLALLSNRSIPL